MIEYARKAGEFCQKRQALMKKVLSYLRDYRKESILGPLFKLLEECGLLEEYLADYPFTYPVGD